MRPAALEAARRDVLEAALNAALAGVDRRAALANDPLQFPHRYAGQQGAAAPHEDAEIAAVFSAVLAYGRVSLFLPVLAKIFALADDAGGPRAWIAGFDAAAAAPLARLSYRWTTGDDLVALAYTLQAALRDGRPLGAHFPAAPTLAATLSSGIAALRAAAPPGVSRSFRTLLSSPADGSACKRWAMLLRWMVRRGGGDVDLGLWSHLSPAALILPLDVHTFRISRLVGLTQRGAANWKTAEEITAALAVFCPEDPVRYDFALAHLGISSGCTGAWAPSVCGGCPLRACCVVAGAAGGSR